MRTSLIAVVAVAGLLGSVAAGFYAPGVRVGVATDERLARLLHDRPADAAALVRLMEANPGLGDELRQAPRATDPATGREIATLTVWVTP